MNSKACVHKGLKCYKWYIYFVILLCSSCSVWLLANIRFVCFINILPKFIFGIMFESSMHLSPSVTQTGTFSLPVKRLKVPTFIYHHLQINPNNSGLIRWIRSGILISTSSRQLVPPIAWMSGLWTRSSSSTGPAMPHNILWQWLTSFSSKYYQLLIYLPQRDGRLSWLKHHKCK